MHIPALNPTQAMPNSLNHRFFISCASNEFRNYRESLRHHLTTHVGEVKVQEDFITSGGTLLEKLDIYVRGSNAVLHLIGDWAGSCAQPAEVQAILNRYPRLADEFSELKGGPLATPCTYSYTQWECYLALYHQVPCYIYIADPASERQPGYVYDATQAASQAAHLARLVARGQDRQNLAFNNAQDVALSFLKAFYSTLVSTLAHAGAKDSALEGLDATALMTHLGQNITRQLDSRALAERAPGNISRSPDHFVGRQKELAELHSVLTAGAAPQGGRGMIVATFSPGGLGKTAFARQYAHVHAGSFAAGGAWEVACEGTTDLGAALLRLADEPSFQALGKALNPPVLLDLEQAQKQDYRLAASAVLGYLHTVLQARADALRREIEPNAPRRGPAQFAPIDQPRALLLLDNVDQPALLWPQQTAQLLDDPWLTLLVTTRLNPQDFHQTGCRFHSIEISVLPAADALQLLRDFQPGQRFDNEYEEAAATEIVRLLGGYTLAVELVGAYLGDRALDGYQPSQYLMLLDKKGLTTVDLLAQDAAVHAQVRHSTDVAQNHIATLIGWSQARLSPAARTALAFASLLMPDEIPLVWLEELTRARHPAEFAHDKYAPPKWPAIWRELHGLRLLHPAGDIEKDARGIEQMPVTVRIHRLVASYVDADNVDASECFAELDHYLDELSRLFDQRVGKSEDAGLKAQHPWLRDQLSHLINLKAYPASPSLLSGATVAANFEGEHGSLERALAFTQRILQAQEACLAASPESAEAARDVSVSLNQLGDFLAARGQSGDAPQALGYYQRSLEIRERLLVANPQVARDVLVSLNQLGDFLYARGQSGDAQQALGYYQRGLEISERLLAANPQSAKAARDVSVSLQRLGGFLSERGQSGDALQALEYFQCGLEISERLLAANPQSAQAARDVSVSLNKLGDFLFKRGQSGDAQQALAYFKRDLEISERLLADNPQSAQAARDVSVSHFKMFHFHQRLGETEPANNHLAQCFAIIDSFAQAGRPMDAQMRQLHAELKPLFS